MRHQQFDDVFQVIGGFGAYQISLFFLLGTICFFNAFHLTGMIMLGASVEHWCQIPTLQNFSHDQQKYIAIPWDVDTDTYSTCEQFDLSFDNYSSEELWTWDREDRTSDAQRVKCSQWVYDQSLFIENAVTKFDLVCDDSHLVPLTSAIFQVGVLVGSLVSGYFSDTYGRKVVLLAGSMLFVVVSFLLIFSPGYWTFTCLRFLISIAQYVSYLGAFVIILEVTGTKYRTLVGTFYNMLYSLGYMTVAIMGYYIRDYTYLCVTWAVPSLVFILLFLVVPESPRWLVAMGRPEKAELILQEIAEVNGREILGKPLLQSHDVIQEVHTETSSNEKEGVSIDSTKHNAEEKTADVGSFKDILRSSILRKELMIIYTAWFASNLLFHGLSLNTGVLPGNIFVNSLLMAAVEIPGVLVCVLTMYYLGRKPSVCGGFIVAGITNLLCIPIIGNEDVSWLVTALALVSKASIKMAFVATMVYTGELFPTPVRPLAIGSSSMVSRIGGIVAPYMGEPAVSVWSALPPLLFGISAILPGLLCLYLPETLNRPLPDTFQEAEHLARYKVTSKQSHAIQTIDASKDGELETSTANPINLDKTISTRL